MKQDDNKFMNMDINQNADLLGVVLDNGCIQIVDLENNRLVNQWNQD